MVTIPSQVKAFLRRVKREFAPEKIYIFGSRATGRATKESDWDFIIVSTRFARLASYHRAVAVYKLSRGDFALDVICFIF